MALTIENLQVHDDAFITCSLVGEPTEIQLDGWNNRRPIGNFSWYSPHLFVGSHDKPLNDGNRTLSAWNAAGEVARADFSIGSVPPPPTETWRTVRTLSRVADWKADPLIEGFSGSTITDTPQGIRYLIPRAMNGERVELQDYFGKEGMTCAYEWTFSIPPETRLSDIDDDENLIHQGHGNEKAGFTSGTSIMYGTEVIQVRVKGGHETSMAGSHRYESERDFYLPKITRGKVHTIRHEVHWHASKGYYRAQLDGGAWSGVYDCPTWPLGDYDGAPSEVIMVRNGWYPQRGIAQGLMDMTCGPMLFQEKV